MSNYKPIILGLVFIASNSLATEFNLDVLDESMRKNIDLNWLGASTSIPPGDYFVSVSVNKNTINSGVTLRWKIQQQQSVVCIPPTLADTFGLKAEIRQSFNTQDECVDFSSRPEITFTLDRPTQHLSISIPQAWLAWQSKNWTPPATWNTGVAGILLDYNLFASSYRPQSGDTSNSVNAYGTAGANLGAWRLRSDYQYNQSWEGNEMQRSGHISRSYLFRPLPTWGAKMTLGETDLSSSIFDGFSFTGASLISDERMLPWELRGYAPQVSGIAQTNATVTVSHNGRVIYQTDVSPGPFVISDLNQSVQGTLDVEVKEEDGRTSRFQVSAASTPFLTRQGQWRYKLASGRARPDISHHTIDDTFVSGEFSWGVLANTSLYGGTLFAGDTYQSGALGVGQNLLGFGAISADITRASSTFADNHEEHGSSYRLNYSKRFDATDSQLSLAAWRFSDRGFHSYARYLDTRYGNDDSDEKQSFSLSASQPLRPLKLNLYVNLLRQMWWDDSPSTTASITASTNFDAGPWKNLSLSTSWSTTHYDDGERDNVFYLSLSVPFSDNRRLGYDMQSGNNLTHTLSWYDASDAHNTWGVSAGVQSEQPDAGALLRGNYQHYSSPGDLRLSGSYAADQYLSANASWSGSFTATPRGLAFHRHSSGNEPRLMISTDGVADIPVQGDLDKTNGLGYAVVPTISSYQPTTVMVNMNALPEGVDVTDNTLRDTWTEGAIGYRQLATRAGAELSASLQLPDGESPPLGATVLNAASQQEIGMVSEKGHLWLSGVSAGQSLRVQWGGHQCRLTLPTPLPAPTRRLNLVCHP